MWDCLFGRQPLLCVLLVPVASVVARPLLCQPRGKALQDRGGFGTGGVVRRVQAAVGIAIEQVLCDGPLHIIQCPAADRGGIRKTAQVCPGIGLQLAEIGIAAHHSGHLLPGDLAIGIEFAAASSPE